MLIYHDDEVRTTIDAPVEAPAVQPAVLEMEAQDASNRTRNLGYSKQNSNKLVCNTVTDAFLYSYGLSVPSHSRSLSIGDFRNGATGSGSSISELESVGPVKPRSSSTHSHTFDRGFHELNTRSRSVSSSRFPRISDLSISDNRTTRSPYNVLEELEPDATFFSRDFQDHLKHGLEIAGKAATSLDKCQRGEVHQPDLKRLLEDANKIKSFRTSKTRTIAILGDSGEGKSSLVNSLLHCPDIAKASDAGMACTSVVTEYHQKKQYHTAPITIEAHYLSDTDIGEFVEELLWSYRQFFMKEWKEGDKDYNKQEAESEIAWSALNAAFGDRGNLKSLFGDDSKEGLQTIKDKLLDWCDGLAWPEGSNGGLWTSTAETAEECCDKTALFMNDRLWPFTKVIRIYLDAQILQSGIVLADLPGKMRTFISPRKKITTAVEKLIRRVGLQDVNLAKVRATERYLFTCDHVFVVARISRAISNQSLKNSLLQTLKNHIPNEWEQLAGKYMNLSIICTHSEVSRLSFHHLILLF